MRPISRASIGIYGLLRSVRGMHLPSCRALKDGCSQMILTSSDSLRAIHFQTRRQNKFAPSFGNIGFPRKSKNTRKAFGGDGNFSVPTLQQLKWKATEKLASSRFRRRDFRRIVTKPPAAVAIRRRNTHNWRPLATSPE